MDAVTTALTSGMQSVGTTLMPIVAVAVTAGFGIFGTKFAISKGMEIFKSATK